MKPALFAIAGGCALAPLARATDAYNNTTTPLNTFHVLLAQNAPNSPERGTSITLAGNDRWVTSVQLKMRIGNGGLATFVGEAILYANDGPAGQPGTRLWTSGPRNQLADAGADMTYQFSTGGVMLPPTATLAYQISNRTNWQAPIGPAQYNPPTVGAPIPGVWERTGATWTSIAPAEPPWGIRLIACYPNCDGSTGAPALNVADFTCFLARFAAGEPYANCDGSTGVPALNVGDFTCYLSRFAAGCP